MKFGEGNSLGSLKATAEAMELLVDYKPLAIASDANAKVSGQESPPKKVIIKPTSGVPLSLYNVPVGLKKAVIFDLKMEPTAVKKAQLALKAGDFDSREEVTIALNGGKPLTIPDALLADMGFRTGRIEVPMNQLRRGKNTVLFTFVSNLKGTTKGYDVAEALLMLEMK